MILMVSQHCAQLPNVVEGDEQGPILVLGALMACEAITASGFLSLTDLLYFWGTESDSFSLPMNHYCVT